MKPRTKQEEVKKNRETKSLADHFLTSLASTLKLLALLTSLDIIKAHFLFIYQEENARKCSGNVIVNKKIQEKFQLPCKNVHKNQH